MMLVDVGGVKLPVAMMLFWFLFAASLAGGTWRLSSRANDQLVEE